MTDKTSLAEVKKIVEELQDQHSKMSGELPFVDKKLGDLISVNITIKDFSFWNKSSQNFPLLAQTLLQLMEDHDRMKSKLGNLTGYDPDGIGNYAEETLSQLYYND